MNLDERFGPPIPPQGFAGRRGYQDWERDFPPRSLTRLEGATAEPLRKLMESVSGGWELGELWINDTILIWLIDRFGQVWFAVEELVLNSQPADVPKHQTMPLTMSCEKLGHPSLVNCQPARIAGEIFFDSTLIPAAWIINNRSGRYGVHETRTREQLERAADLFSNYGIDLEVVFI